MQYYRNGPRYEIHHISHTNVTIQHETGICTETVKEKGREKEGDRAEELGEAFVRSGNEHYVGKAATFGANNLDRLNFSQLRRGEGPVEIGCLHV